MERTQVATAGRPAEALSESEPQRAARRFARLDNFVVGSCNRVAFTAAQMVAERPGPVSPLFLYGPAGCGKTHLLEGIWSAVRGSSQSRRVLYLTAEQFTSMFLEALRGSGLPSFRHKYRHVDLLLIDDVQFFLGKRATLVELQNTVDALLRERRQLVLAADRSPSELAKFGPVLTTRFSGGLVCGIEPPGHSTRLEILRNLDEASIRSADGRRAGVDCRSDGRRCPEAGRSGPSSGGGQPRVPAADRSAVRAFRSLGRVSRHQSHRAAQRH